MMKLLQPFLWLFFLCVTVQEINAQVGINTETPDASAVLDIVSKNNDKGLFEENTSRLCLGVNEEKFEKRMVFHNTMKKCKFD